MTLELASVRVVRKPWGKTDLRPWSELGHDGTTIGELWFQRADPAAVESALLLKLLFTEEALSIQVHPDDTFARAIGLPHGKTEAWYVLATGPHGEVSLGLRHPLTAPQLRGAIVDGTILDHMQRQAVHAGEAISVPAGTIHSIGAGLVIAEIQQRSDATFRLFDYGRRRELHLDGAVGATIFGTTPTTDAPQRISHARLVVAKSPYFVLEQIDLTANSNWEVAADREIWVLLLKGAAKFGQLQVNRGEAVFIEDQHVRISVGSDPVTGLMAYAESEPVAGLLQSRDSASTGSMIQPFPELENVPRIARTPATHARGIRP